MPNSKLNPRQSAFIDAYTTPGTKGYRNATHAAVAAGYEPTSARTQGPRLLTHVGVSAAIREREAAAARKSPE